jgi:hypothetical protein
MNTGLIIIATLVLSATMLLWRAYGQSRRHVNSIMLANVLLFLTYTAASFLGESPCGPDHWFCSRWYEDVQFYFILHASLFWVLIVFDLAAAIPSVLKKANTTLKTRQNNLP